MGNMDRETDRNPRREDDGETGRQDALPRPADPNREARELGRSTMRWMSVGIEFCIVVCLFAYLGNLADAYFKTRPWLMILGFFIGFILMTYWLLRATRDYR